MVVLRVGVVLGGVEGVAMSNKCPWCGDGIAPGRKRIFECGTWNVDEAKQTHTCKLRCAERRIAELEAIIVKKTEAFENLTIMHTFVMHERDIAREQSNNRDLSQWGLPEPTKDDIERLRARIAELESAILQRDKIIAEATRQLATEQERIAWLEAALLCEYCNGTGRDWDQHGEFDCRHCKAAEIKRAAKAGGEK